MSRQATDANRNILISTAASILMYIECLMVAGSTLEEAKSIALRKFQLPTEAYPWRWQIVEFVRGIRHIDITRTTRRLNREATYYATLHVAGQKDGVVRRCLFLWLGVWL